MVGFKIYFECVTNKIFYYNIYEGERKQSKSNSKMLGLSNGKNKVIIKWDVEGYGRSRLQHKKDQEFSF